jgi:hypothetical protein
MDSPSRLRRCAAALALLLALGGCPVDYVRPDENLADNAYVMAHPMLAEGEWEISTTTIPRAGQPLPPPQVSRTRIDGLDAVRPTSRVFAITGEGCREQRMQIRHGAINGALTCPGEGSAPPVRYVVNGNYSLRAFHITVVTERGNILLRQERSGRFVGD